DAVVTTGGVSAGAYDVVKEVLEPLGDVTFTAVAMQPGKPQGFGVLTAPDGRAVPIFCLPGNPVSVYVSVHVLVRPALARMGGTDDPRRTVPAVAAEGWSCLPGRRQYIPVVLDPQEDDAGAVTLRVRPAAAGGSGSHLV